MGSNHNACKRTADPVDAPLQDAGNAKEHGKPPDTQPVKRGPGRPRKEAPAQRGPNLLDLWGHKRERTNDAELKTESTYGIEAIGGEAFEDDCVLQTA
mmetsp:Transcript_2474/g.2693  ORF Transcript_2474/g.2693 Transcript_2474/m.2693 type:complete len:98 (-) Transcript_2474:425-718(-)